MKTLVRVVLVLFLLMQAVPTVAAILEEEPETLVSIDIEEETDEETEPFKTGPSEFTFSLRYSTQKDLQIISDSFRKHTSVFGTVSPPEKDII